MNYDIASNMVRELNAINFLYPKGWTPRGDWRFEKDGKLYDLSAADLGQINKIEKEGLFIEEAK